MRETAIINADNSNAALKFLYNTVPGRVLLKLCISPAVSKAMGWFLSTGVSKAFIGGTIQKNGIDMSRFTGAPYRSYNDFFTRRLAPDAMKLGAGLIAPCDSKLTAYRIDENSVFDIKGGRFSLSEILQDRELAGELAGGLCLIFRLVVSDYHHYCYFDNCRVLERKVIPGVLHTVQPIAFHDHPVYHCNAREVTVMQTEGFGKAVQVEVGALGVGKIVNSHSSGTHLRGEEKGRFEFGGSTVMLLLKNAELDPEIMENTAGGLETVVSIGEQIGK